RTRGELGRYPTGGTRRTFRSPPAQRRLPRRREAAESRLFHLGTDRPRESAAVGGPLIESRPEERMGAPTAVATHDIKDLALADEGKRRTEWAERSMPVLRQIRARFAKERPLNGVKLPPCLHVTTETANLMQTLRAAGAEIALC